MNPRKYLWCAVPALAIAIGVAAYGRFMSVGVADTINPTAGPKVVEPLPIRQVVLFNSGLGYFQREGDVTGNARIDLSFPATEINDLLKSLLLQDAKGQIGTVSYDSSDPIDKILRSFALDLTGNPTFAQILNQARGEKIEISRAPKDGPAVKFTGAIIGMEMQRRIVGKDVHETEMLNLNTPAGLQAIPMDQIVAVKFQNAALETEFQRALQVLARSHDTQKKTVSVGFNGAGKRSVRVGYVLERPIWKTTYRLRIDPKGKIYLQGWALVENTSDDDWNDIRMVLVSGKPIAFRMNLYDPIYVPRPLVEPEMFASLRPPVYSGALGDGLMKQAQQEPRKALEQILNKLQTPATDSGNAGGSSTGSVDQRNFKRLVGDWGRLPPREQQRELQLLMNDMAPRHREALENYFRNLSAGKDVGKYLDKERITYEELLDRLKDKAAKKIQEASKSQGDAIAKLEDARGAGSAITGFNFKEGIQSLATAGEIGDYYQYVIDQKISLPRQKSAMLPILDQNIEGQKFSIYNEAVHAKYPLLGLKLKNTSGQPLTQGPITVYDGAVFGGDTRILDVQPDEDRLLSYALDQGTEVKTEIKETPSPDMNLRIGSDGLTAKYEMRQIKTYTIKNRSPHDRQVLIEHPLRAGWKLIEPKKPAEETRDLYRFQVTAPSGKTVKLEVVEDKPAVDSYAIRPSLAVTTGITIKTETTTDFHKLSGLKIVKGVVLATHKTRETKAYFVQNLSDIDRTFTVDHVVRPGWTRLDDKNDPQAGPEAFRFKLSVAKGKTGEQSVREERSVTDKGSLLKALSETTVRDYLASNVPSADVKAAFTKSLAMQGKIADTQKQIADAEKQLTILTADHTRVRENLKIIPPTSEHYKTFLEKFVNQDKQIETAQVNMRQLSATLQMQLREYEQLLAKLDAE